MAAKRENGASEMVDEEGDAESVGCSAEDNSTHAGDIYEYAVSTFDAR